MFYTFGTVFLAAMIAVCTMNFVRDGRIFQASAAFAENTADKTTETEKKSEEFDTLKYNKNEKTDSSKSSSKSSTGQKSSDNSDKAASGKGTQTKPVADP